jgi:chorismate-pyruvate lyase
MEQSSSPGLRELFEVFAHLEPIDIPEFQVVAPEHVPQPYRDLLVHEHHMTVTVERFHGRPVELRVLSQRTQGHHYSRMILLALQGTGDVVQFGIVRIDLDRCSPVVRAEVLAGEKPLGRILIEHDVLRHIDPTCFVRITPTRQMLQWFGLAESGPLWGRTATIHCDGQRAIDLLEVVRNESP